MQLYYRGICYESKSQAGLLQTGDRPITGKYRGVTFQLNPLTQKDLPQAPQKLSYRGATYLR